MKKLLLVGTAIALVVTGTLAYNVNTTKAVTNTVPILIQDKETTMPTNNEPTTPDEADIAPAGQAPDSVPTSPDTAKTAPTTDSDTQTDPQPEAPSDTSEMAETTTDPLTGLPSQANPQIIRNDDGKPVGTFFLAN